MRISTRNLPALKHKYGSLAAAAKMSMANRPFPVQGDEIPTQEEPQPAQEDKPKLRGAMLGQYFIDDFCPAIQLKSEPKPKTELVTIACQYTGAWKNEPFDMTIINRYMESLSLKDIEFLSPASFEIDWFRGWYAEISIVPRRPVERMNLTANVVLAADGSTHIVSGKTTITSNEPIAFRG